MVLNLSGRLLGLENVLHVTKLESTGLQVAYFGWFKHTLCYYIC